MKQIKDLIMEYWDNVFKNPEAIIFKNGVVYQIGSHISGIDQGSLYWEPLYNTKYFWSEKHGFKGCNNLQFLGIMPKSLQSEHPANAIWLSPEQYHVLVRYTPTHQPNLQEIEKYIQEINDNLLNL